MAGGGHGALGATRPPESRIDAEVVSEISRAGAADIVIQIKRTEPLIPFAPFEQPLRGKDLAEARRIQKLIARDTGNEPYFGGFSLLARVRGNTMALLANEMVVDRIRLSRNNAPMTSLTNAIALSAASPALFSPSLGSGDEVMIIEGSFDPEHPALVGSRIVEHCFGVGTSTSQIRCDLGIGTALERHGAGAARMSLPSSNVPPIMNAQFHGMSVSSIVAAVNTPFESGFAPQAVLHLANVSGNIASGWRPILDPSPGYWASQLPDSTILKALTWAIAYKTTPAGARLRAINLSLGRYPSGSEMDCSSFGNFAEYSNRFATLRAKGVLVSVAAGNEAGAARHFPACIQNAFAVTMSCNVNSGCPSGQMQLAPGTTLSTVAAERPKVAAPSAPVSAATTLFDAAGVRNHVTGWFGGTSGAAPMVAGCAALVGARFAAEGRVFDLDTFTSALQLAPAVATRPGAPYSVPLLNCYQAYQKMVLGGATINPNNHRLTGTYFDFSASGQGFVFEVNPVQGTLTGGWFSSKTPVNFYAGQGQHWLSLNRIGLEGPQMHTVVMDILAQRFSNRRPLFNTPNGAASGVHSSYRVGTARLTFRSCDSAQFSYQFDGPVPPATQAFPQALQGTIALQRLGVSFGCATNPKVQEGLPETPAISTWMPSTVSGIWGRGVQVNGNWEFDPNYSGQGLMIDSGPSASPYMFGGWYTYAGAFDTIGDPSSIIGNLEYLERYRWLTFVASPDSIPGTGILNPTGEPHEYTADLSITAGGTFVLPMPEVIPYVVGQVKVKFHSCRRATFNYSFANQWPPLSGGRGFDGITGFPFPSVPSTWTTGSFEIIRVLADPVSGCTLP